MDIMEFLVYVAILAEKFSSTSFVSDMLYVVKPLVVMSLEKYKV